MEVNVFSDPCRQGFRHSPRHGRRLIRARACEEKPVVDPAESEPESSSVVRKRKVTKRVQPEFYHSVQVTPTRRPVGVRFTFLFGGHSLHPQKIHFVIYIYCIYVKRDYYILKVTYLDLFNPGGT